MVGGNHIVYNDLESTLDSVMPALLPITPMDQLDLRDATPLSTTSGASPIPSCDHNTPTAPHEKADPMRDFAGSAQTTAGAVTLGSSAKPVPLIDDKGRPVLDANGKQILRPEGFDPHFFVDRGRAAASIVEQPNPFNTEGSGPAYFGTVFGDLSNFRQGGAWDAQRAGGQNHPDFINDATINIGLYGAAAGIPQDLMLRVENEYAAEHSHFPTVTKMDPEYTHLPKTNVQNTQLGYQLYESGRIGL